MPNQIDFYTINKVFANSNTGLVWQSGVSYKANSYQDISLSDYYYASVNVSSSGDISMDMFSTLPGLTSLPGHVAYFPTSTSYSTSQTLRMVTGTMYVLAPSNGKWTYLTSGDPSSAYVNSMINFITSPGMYQSTANAHHKIAFATETGTSVIPTKGGIITTANSGLYQATPAFGSTPNFGVSWGGYISSSDYDTWTFKYIFSSDTITSVINGNTTGYTPSFTYPSNPDGGTCYSWGDKMIVIIGFSNSQALTILNGGSFSNQLKYVTSTDTITRSNNPIYYSHQYSAHAVSPTKGYNFGGQSYANTNGQTWSHSTTALKFDKSTEVHSRVTGLPAKSAVGMGTHDQSYGYYWSNTTTAYKFSYSSETAVLMTNTPVLYENPNFNRSGFSGVSNLGFPK